MYKRALLSLLKTKKYKERKNYVPSVANFFLFVNFYFFRVCNFEIRQFTCYYYRHFYYYFVFTFDNILAIIKNK